MTKWTLNGHMLNVLDEMVDVHSFRCGENAERDSLCDGLCAEHLCAIVDDADGEPAYFPTIAGEAVLSACIDNNVDFDGVMTVTVEFNDDSLEDAVVDALY